MVDIESPEGTQGKAEHFAEIRPIVFTLNNDVGIAYG